MTNLTRKSKQQNCLPRVIRLMRNSHLGLIDGQNSNAMKISRGKYFTAKVSSFTVRIHETAVVCSFTCMLSLNSNVVDGTCMRLIQRKV